MNEKISALMDGDLDERSSGQVIDSIKSDARARETWDTYHLIGDALRGTRPLGEGFAARVAWRLADEPAILAPRNLPQERRPRFALAAAASVAAVALVGWLAFAPQPQAPIELAKVTPAVAVKPAPARAQPVIVPLPSATNDYLLAHQGFSPRLAIQGVAPYVITVSEQPRK